MRGVRRSGLGLALAFLLAAATSASAEEVRGVASVVSGNELIVGKRKVRLFGMRAPAPDETCRVNGAKMKCGIVAWARLIEMADGWYVSCDIERRVPRGPDYATCYVSERDLNENMVRSGWARAVRKQTDRYVVDEEDARQSKRGLWADERSAGR